MRGPSDTVVSTYIASCLQVQVVVLGRVRSASPAPRAGRAGRAAGGGGGGRRAGTGDQQPRRPRREPPPSATFYAPEDTTITCRHDAIQLRIGRSMKTVR